MRRVLYFPPPVPHLLPTYRSFTWRLLARLGVNGQNTSKTLSPGQDPLICVPYVYALYVCLMYALHVCLTYEHTFKICVCLICVPYICLICVPDI